MPGKHGNEATWWMMLNSTAVYRTVSSSDTETAAGVEAITQVYDRNALPGVAPIRAAYNSLLQVYAVADATVTGFAISVYVEAPVVSGAGRWCLMEKVSSITGSRLLSFRDVPAAKVKVLVTGMTGTGNVQLVLASSV